MARFRRRTFHEPNIILIKAHPSYLIPIQALQRTYQLRGMASTLRMRTTVSPLIGAHQHGITIWPLYGISRFQMHFKNK